MEIRGLTPVDTLYEYSGHSVGLLLGNYLIWSGTILGFVVAAAIIRLYYVGSIKGSFTDLAVYPIYVLILMLLLWPIPVDVAAPGSEQIMGDGEGGFISGQDGIFWDPTLATEEDQETLERHAQVRVPRVLAYSTALIDALQGSFIHAIDRKVYLSNFEWLRITEISQKSRILDPNLRRDLGIYLAHCYWPAIYTRRSEDAQPWESVPLAGLPIDGWLEEEYLSTERYYKTTEATTLFPHKRIVPCPALHGALHDAIHQHVSTEPFHHEAVGTFRKLAEAEGNGQTADAYQSFYLRRLLYNEVFILAGGEAASVRYALPEFELMSGFGWNYTHMSVGNLEGLTSDSVWDRVGAVWEDIPDILAAILATLSEWWTQKALGPGTYYRISAMGPYIYGMVQALLLMLFPVAGLMAFWPRWWTAIINFMKVYLSVKLWPIFWSYLSAVISHRGVFNPEDPEGFQGTFGHEGMVTGFVGMYLLAPLLSYVVVSLATYAGMMTMGALAGMGTTGSPMSAVGAIGSVARGGASAWNAGASAWSAIQNRASVQGGQQGG